MPFNSLQPNAEKPSILKDHILPMLYFAAFFIFYLASIFLITFFIGRWVGYQQAFFGYIALSFIIFWRVALHIIARPYVRLGFSRKWNCYEGNYQGMNVKTRIGIPFDALGYPVNVSFTSPYPDLKNRLQILDLLPEETIKRIQELRGEPDTTTNRLSLQVSTGEIRLQYWTGALNSGQQVLAENVLNLLLQIKSDIEIGLKRKANP